MYLGRAAPAGRGWCWRDSIEGGYGRGMMARLLVVMLLLTAAAPVRAQVPAILSQGVAAAAEKALEKPAPPAEPPAPPVTKQQAQEVLDILKDDKKRQDFTNTLEAITKAVPAAPAEEKPAAIPIPLAPDSLGAEVLDAAAQWSTWFSDSLGHAAETAARFPSLLLWAQTLVTDPLAQDRLLDTGWRLGVVLGCGLAVEWLAVWLLRRARRGVQAWAPLPAGDEVPPELEGMARAESGQTEPGHWRPGTELLLRRLPVVVLVLLIDVLPLVLFVGVSHALIGGAIGGTHITRLSLLVVADSYVMCRLVLCVVRLLLSPDAPALRLTHVTDADAVSILRWARVITGITVAGYMLAEVGLLFGMSLTWHDILLKLVALVVVVAVVVIIRRNREAVAAIIRPAADAEGAVANARRRLAKVWTLVGGFYLLAMWFVWAVEIPNGFERLLRLAVRTTLVLIAARLLIIICIGALERWTRRHPNADGLEERLGRHRNLLRASVRVVIAAGTCIALAEAWGFNSVGWFRGDGLGSRLAGAALSIVLVLFAALLIWEGTNLAIDRHMARLTREAQMARTARLRTLLPMLRTTLLIVILLFVVLSILAEIGVNIAPLLAGAGVIGLAIGFGSQKLVQDIINGLFLLMENAMQVGDTVTVAGVTGTVEALSVRTIRLRAVDGSVHIIPFSAVTTVTNQTRDFGYAVLDVSAGLNEEPDHIADIMRGIAKEMRAEPRWASAIRDDLEVMGVERFIDQAWVLRCRIKTQPTQRWAVAREFNRRIKYKFDELAIESPITSYHILQTTPPTTVQKIVPATVTEGSPR